MSNNEKGLIVRKKNIILNLFHFIKNLFKKSDVAVQKIEPNIKNEFSKSIRLEDDNCNNTLLQDRIEENESYLDQLSDEEIKRVHESYQKQIQLLKKELERKTSRVKELKYSLQ